MGVKLSERTMSVDGGGPELGQVVLTGDRTPLRRVADLRGQDVVVLTRAELDARLQARWRAGMDAGLEMAPAVGRDEGGTDPEVWSEIARKASQP